MENKNVGYLILGISAVIIIIIFLFNLALKKIVRLSCGDPHSLTCPMNITVNEQTYLALAIVIILIIVGLFLIFTKPKEKIVVKTIKEKKIIKKVDTSGLRDEDKKVLELIQQEGTIFQANLIEKTEFGKAKVSRILDRLEGKGLVERKRRGMTNVVVLKQD